MTGLPFRLDSDSLLSAVAELSERDPLLETVVAQYGPPPLWARNEGFESLIHIILEQQVSLASAQAAYDKLLRRVGDLTPENYMQLSDAELKRAGFSRQKTAYCRNLAAAMMDGQLDLTALVGLEDGEVEAQLTTIKGIGPWTARIYLLMALGRPDIWPDGDIALASAFQQLSGKETRPSFDELNKISLGWKPLRSVAARILWHFYLSEGGKGGG